MIIYEGGQVKSLAGFAQNVTVNKLTCESSEIASGSALGYFFAKSTRRLKPIERTYRRACSVLTQSSSLEPGEPMTSKIKLSCCIDDLPGNIGRRPSTSPKMHPTLQRSTAAVYLPSGHSMSSGLRYQRVTTCCVFTTFVGEQSNNNCEKDIFARSVDGRTCEITHLCHEASGGVRGYASEAKVANLQRAVPVDEQV